MTVTISIGIGLIAGFVFTELTGLYAGGLVVPGYLALYLDQPLRIVATFLVALAAYAIVWAISNFVAIYGRRRFMACVIVGFWLGWLLNRTGISITPGGPQLRAIGYIIPGLIANDIARQGALRTFVSVILVASVTRLLMIVFS